MLFIRLAKGVACFEHVGVEPRMSSPRGLI